MKDLFLQYDSKQPKKHFFYPHYGDLGSFWRQTRQPDLSMPWHFISDLSFLLFQVVSNHFWSPKGRCTLAKNDFPFPMMDSKTVSLKQENRQETSTLYISLLMRDDGKGAGLPRGQFISESSKPTPEKLSIISYLIFFALFWVSIQEKKWQWVW